MWTMNSFNGLLEVKKTDKELYIKKCNKKYLHKMLPNIQYALKYRVAANGTQNIKYTRSVTARFNRNIFVIVRKTLFLIKTKTTNPFPKVPVIIKTKKIGGTAKLYSQLVIAVNESLTDIL
jgi:hypothetical protein